MYRSISATLLITGFSSAIFASEPDLEGVTVGSPKFAPAAAVETAFYSCAKQFIEEIMPGRDVSLRTRLDSESRDIFRFPPARRMTFQMTATSRRTGTILARSECTVDDFTVVHQQVKNKNSAALAALKTKDISWSLAMR